MACTDEISVTLFVDSENDQQQLDLSGKCSGSMTLVDYVRPKIRRKLGLQLTQQHNRRMILRMTRSGGCSWMSPMRDFKVCTAIYYRLRVAQHKPNYLTFHLSSRKFALYNAYIISLLSLAAKTDKMYSVVISILCDIFADRIEI